MITATEKAAQRLKDVLTRRFLDVGVGFRVLGNTGEAGHTTFDIKLDNKHAGDEVIESYGVKFFLDERSAALLGDCQLDYVDGPDAGFIIKATEDKKA